MLESDQLKVIQTEETGSWEQRFMSKCFEHEVACCRKGKLFLTPDEVSNIRDYIGNDAAQLQEFNRRLKSYDTFSIYDQESRCQFLDDRWLCKLHTPGKKPAECFWWPIHAYVNDADEIELRITTSDECPASELARRRGSFRSVIVHKHISEGMQFAHRLA